MVQLEYAYFDTKMGNFVKLAAIAILAGGILTSVSFASFQPVRSYVYFKNKNTWELTYLKNNDYAESSLFDIWVSKYLNGKNINDDWLFDDWIPIAICRESFCFDKWTIWSGTTRGYDIRNDDRLTPEEHKIDQSKARELWIQDLSMDENFWIFMDYIFAKLIGQFLIFLPLNLIIFQCLGYLMYMVLYKECGLAFFWKAYGNACIVYFLTTGVLYLCGVGFLNYSSGAMATAGYWIIAFAIKFPLLLTSSYTMKKAEKLGINKTRMEQNMLAYVILFYIIVFVASFIFNRS